MFINRDSFMRIVESLHEGLYIVDKSRTIQYWNKSAERISGFTRQEVVGRSCRDNILNHVDGEGHRLCDTICPLQTTIRDGMGSETDIFLHHKNGHRIPVAVRSSTLTDDTGNVIGGVEMFSDISELKFIESRVRELEQLALIDNLTQLANRNFIEKELHLRMEELKRFGNLFGFLFMDIDYFKQFNDVFGHDVGDRVLRFVADTMVRNSRPFDVFGRWGGEEFIGIMKNITEDQLGFLANRLRVLVESSFIPIKDKKIGVTISMGASMVRKDDTAQTLIKRADELLYESKKNGRNRVTLG